MVNPHMPPDSAPQGSTFVTGLVVGAFLLNLFVVIIAGVSIEQSRMADEKSAAVSTQNLSQVIEHQVASSVDKIDLALRVAVDELDKRRASRSSDRRTLKTYLARIRGYLPEVTTLSVADADGNVVLAADTDSAFKTSVAGRDYFTRLRDNPDAQWTMSRVDVDRATGKRMIYLARRRNRTDGSFAGTVFAGIEIEKFAQMLSAIDVDAHGALALRDGELALITRQPASGNAALTMGAKGASPELKQMIDAGQSAGTFFAVPSPDDVDRAVSFRRVSGYPLYVIVALAKDDYLAQWRRDAAQLAWLVVVLIATSVVLSWLIYRNWNRLTGAVQALRRSEDKFAKMFHASPIPINLCRLEDGCYLDVNDTFIRTYGWSRDELVGRTSVEAGIWQSSADRQRWTENLAAHGRSKDFEVTMRAREGELRTVLFSAEKLELDGEQCVLGLAYDITERKRMEAEIHALNDQLERRVALRTAELERANRDLDAFSYSISHDLRAPLRAISGFADMLKHHHAPVLDAQGHDLLLRISSNTQRMAAMIEHLLDFSRSSRCGLTLQQIDLVALAHDVVGEIGPAYGRASVHIGPLPSVTGDGSLLRQVFQNLIGNAFKYSAKVDAPRIEIGTRAAQDGTVIFVQDNGAGFEMKYAQRLFTVFQRFHSQAQFAGTGVGLAIVKSIVERHGGRVWADSTPNAGATFYFTLGDAATAAAS
jgi:PAS domain S-box-containing protein